MCVRVCRGDARLSSFELLLAHSSQPMGEETALGAAPVFEGLVLTWLASYSAPRSPCPISWITVPSKVRNI